MGPIKWEGSSVNVVMVASGYPNKPITGDRIHLKNVADLRKVMLFHGATRREGASLYTNGGRVLEVVGLGETVEEARSHAYCAVKKIKWKGATCRFDIAKEAELNGPHSQQHL